MVKSRREKLLLLLLAALVAGALLYYALAGLLGYEGRLDQQILRKQALLAKARTLTARLGQFSGRSAAARKRKGSLIGHIEQLAARNALKDRIRLNRVPLDKSKGLEAIDVKVDRLALDELVGFIYAIENSQPILVVDQMEITPSIRAKDLMRLSARVLAQK